MKRINLACLPLCAMYVCLTVAAIQNAQAQTWETLSRIPASAGMQQILVSSSGAMYAYRLGENTQSWRSLDGGKSWHLLLHHGQLALLDDGRLYVAENMSNKENFQQVLMSEDNGFEWKQLLEGQNLRIFTGKDRKLYVAEDSRLTRYDKDSTFTYPLVNGKIQDVLALENVVVATGSLGAWWIDDSDATSWGEITGLDGNCFYGKVFGTALDSLYLLQSKTNGQQSRPCKTTIASGVETPRVWLGELPQGETQDLALFDALTAYAANSVLGVVRRNVAGIWFTYGLENTRCHSLCASPDGTLYALDSSNAVFRLPRADEPYKRLELSGNFNIVTLLNKIRIDTIEIHNAGLKSIVIDSVRLASGAGAPLRIVNDAADIPAELLPGETLPVLLETLFTENDSTSHFDTLTVHAGDLRIVRTLNAGVNIPKFEFTSPDIGLVYFGQTQHLIAKMRNQGEIAVRFDSATYIVNTPAEIVSDVPLEERYPFVVQAKDRKDIGWFIRPLRRDTATIIIRYHTDVGDLDQTIHFATPEVFIKNPTNPSDSAIHFNSALRAPFSLLVHNYGNIDYTVQSVQLSSEPAVIAIDHRRVKTGTFLTCGSDMIIPLIVREKLDTVVSCRLTVHTDVGVISTKFRVRLLNNSVDMNYDWASTHTARYADKLTYSGDGKRLIVFTASCAQAFNSSDGRLVAAIQNNRTFDVSVRKIWPPKNDVGFSHDANIAAVGSRYPDGDVLRTSLDLIDVNSLQVLKTVQFAEEEQRIYSAKLLAGDSLVALAFGVDFHTYNDEWSEGKFGIYSLNSDSWKYLNDNLPSRPVQLVGSGKHVLFQRVYYRTHWAGRGTTYWNDNDGFLYNSDSNAVLSIPMKNFDVNFSADDQVRIYHHRDPVENTIIASMLQRNAVRYTYLAGIEPGGCILPDGEHYAYIPTDYWGKANLNFLRIVHLKSGGIVVGECFEHDIALNAFAISPDGSKIAFVDVNGLVWQQDFDCELEDIRTVAVDEADVNKDFSLRVFPNPTNSLLLVAHPEMSSGRVRILDMTGRESLSFTFSDKQESQVNVESLSPGVYCLEVSDGSRHASQLFVRR